MSAKTTITHTGALRRPRFDAHRCKRCGVCASVCPTEAIGLETRAGAALARPDACTGCSTCELICPDFAVSMSGAAAGVAAAASAPGTCGRARGAAGGLPTAGAEA